MVLIYCCRFPFTSICKHAISNKDCCVFFFYKNNKMSWFCYVRHVNKAHLSAYENKQFPLYTWCRIHVGLFVCVCLCIARACVYVTRSYIYFLFLYNYILFSSFYIILTHTIYKHLEKYYTYNKQTRSNFPFTQ